VQLTPNDAEKIVYIRNDLSGGRAIALFQGTYNASNDYEVPAGTTAVVFFNGGGAGAVAANLFNNAFFDSLRLGGVSVTAILDEDNMASDSDTALATQQSIKAYVDAQVGANNELSEILANGNTSGGNDIQMTTTDEVQFRDTALKISSSVDGQLDIAADVELEIVAPTLDINASTAVTIDTTTMTMTGSVNVVGDLDVDNLNINGNAIISTNTNGNIALTPNGTGEVDISKVDIDGGTIDGVTIGGASAGAGTFTTLTATGNVTLGDAATDTVTFTADVASSLIPSADNTYDLGASGSEWKDLFIDGTANIDSLVANTADINGGTIDGVTLGTNSAVTEAQIDNLNINGNSIISTNTDGNIALTPNGTGEVDISKVDIDGGTIDGTVIGGSTPAAISGTTGQFGTSLNVDGTITSDGLTVDSSVSTFQSLTGRASPTPTELRIASTDNGSDWSTTDPWGRLAFYSNDASVGGAKTAVSLDSVYRVTNGGSANLEIKTYSFPDGLLLRQKIESNGDISFYEDTGTTPKFFWDASAERLGIGTSSPASALEIVGSVLLQNNTSAINFKNAAGTARNVLFADSSDITRLLSADGAVAISAGGSERLRIDASGNLLVGTTTIEGNGLTIRPNLDNGATRIIFERAATTASSLIQAFNNGTTNVGSISHTNTTTSYTTSSDYRLKEDAQPIANPSERLLALKPVNFAWKVDGSRMDGFMAHEAQEVVPEAVTGEKDAVDKDGNPEYQGIDQSKIVPLLTAALQEALKKIEALEARVAALEA
jgi:hypothetical protein